MRKEIPIPSRGYVQAELTKDFIATLRGSTEVGYAINSFYDRHQGILDWLGERRQDEMIKEAQRSTGIDLSYWLENETLSAEERGNDRS